MQEQLILSQTSVEELAEQLARKVLEKIQAEKSKNTFAKKILSLNEFSEEYQIPKATIYAWTSQRKVPFIKKGKRLYFDREKIEEWFKTSEKRIVNFLNDF